MIRAGLIRQLTPALTTFCRWFAKFKKAERSCARRWTALAQPKCFCRRSNRSSCGKERPRCEIRRDMFRVKDRHGRWNVLGPTHENAHRIDGRAVKSYKQLPNFALSDSDEIPRRAAPALGLLRVREFLMKDAYSFDANVEAEQILRRDVRRISEDLTRCGLPFVTRGRIRPIGGSAATNSWSPATRVKTRSSHPTRATTQRMLKKRDRKREFTFSAEPTGALERVHTPNLPASTMSESS